VQLVLVHGAWQGAWAWRELETTWNNEEVALRSLDLPSTSGVGDLAGDADAVVAFANGIDDEVLLVGHSYGGAVITEASARIARLRGLVYVAALRPSIGESAYDSVQRSTQRSLLDEAIRVDGDALTLDPELASEALFGTTDPSIVTWALQRLHPQPLQSFRQPLTSGVPNDAATHYIVCERDQAILPDLQTIFAAECESTWSIEAAHCPQLEYPRQLEELLSMILRSVS
jgi:pimeloyl-ACP methyl ester carboxylesterase